MWKAVLGILSVTIMIVGVFMVDPVNAATSVQLYGIFIFITLVLFMILDEVRDLHRSVYSGDIITVNDTPWKDFPNTDNLPIMELTKDQYELAKDSWIVYVNGKEDMCFSMNGINWYMAKLKEENNETR